jgi:tetratricopeptide (TPR) repeat protein
MKAIEKERTRRYETANGMALDVRRYLTGQPVLAAPPSRVYRLRKFVRRNRVLVGAGLMVAVTLLAGIVGFAWQARIAQQRAAELEQVSRFQAEMLGQVDPTQAGELLTADVQGKFAEALSKTAMSPGERAAQIDAFAQQWQRLNATDAARELIDRTILAPAAEAIEKQFADQPLVNATLSQVLAERYRRIGLYEAALPLQKRAVAVRHAVLGDAHPDTLSSLNALGNLLRDQGKLDEAETIWRETLRMRREVLGNAHADTQASVNNMGVILYMQGRLSEVEPYFLESLQTRRRVLGSDHKDTLSSLNNMGVLLQDQGKLSEAETYYREALEKYRVVLGDEHPNTLSSIANMGNLLEAQGKLDEAEPYFRESLEKSRRLLGAEHPDTLSSISDMGELLHDQGRFAEAEPYYREALDERRSLLGAESPETLSSIANMAALLTDQGKLDAADSYAVEALDKSRRIIGEEHPETLNMTISVGALRVAQGRYADAVELLSAVETASRAAFTGGYAYRTAKLLTELGKSRAALADFPGAQANLTEAHAIFQTAPGPTSRDMRACVQALAKLYADWASAEPGGDHLAQAEKWQREQVVLDQELPVQ